LLLHLESINAWSTFDAEKANPTDDNKTNTPAWPKLDFVPAMQRRRLSPFAKIALYTAENALSTPSTLSETLKSETSRSETAEQAAQIDIVFSSRHGDLHKTAELLTELSADQDISPTAFSTSVHNAVPGLYSILKQNKQAINAISAGKDSFFYAFVDAYARLKSGRSNKLLIVHVDRELPALYAQFQDEQQIAHAVAMVVTLTPTPATIANIDINFSASPCSAKDDKQDAAELNLPAALCFMHWFDASASLTPSPSPSLEYTSDRHVWTCDYVVETYERIAGIANV
jgi:3-oxoacyl-(acyl-carrier-protein) synthase